MCFELRDVARACSSVVMHEIVGCTFDVVAHRCEKFQTERIRRFVRQYIRFSSNKLEKIALHPRLSELNIHSRDFSCQSKHYLRIKKNKSHHFIEKTVVLGVLQGGDLKDDRRRTENQNIPIQD